MTTDRAHTTVPRPGRARQLVAQSKEHLVGAKQRTKELGWLLFGRLAMTGANSILMLLLSVMLLDLQTFGLFATSVAAQLVLSRLVLLGVDQGVIRLFTVDGDDDRAPADVLRTGLGSALTLSAPVLLVGLLLGVLGLGHVDPLLSSAVIVSIALGATGTALFDYGYADHLARLEYRAAAGMQASMPILRLIATVAVAALAPADSYLCFVAYAGVALSFGVWQTLRIRAGGRLWPGLAEILRLLRYARWIGMADVAMILALQQGLFLLKVLSAAGSQTSAQDAGIYGFSLTLGMGFFAVYIAFYQAILPRAARIQDIGSLPRFLAKVYTMALALVAVCVPVAWAIGTLLPDYLAQWKPDEPELALFAPSFYMYAAFTMLLILEAPLGVTCQYLLRPQLQLVAMTARCLAILGLGLYLVQTGPAAAGDAAQVGDAALAVGQAQAAGGAVGFATLAVLVLLAVRAARRQVACAES